LVLDEKPGTLVADRRLQWPLCEGTGEGACPPPLFHRHALGHMQYKRYAPLKAAQEL